MTLRHASFICMGLVRRKNLDIVHCFSTLVHCFSLLAHLVHCFSLLVHSSVEQKPRYRLLSFAAMGLIMQMDQQEKVLFIEDLYL